MSGYFKCMVHHGGNFIKTGDHYRYEGNESLWDCIEDKWSYFEVLWLLRKLNYPKGAVLWYDDGGADSRVGYKEFNDDKGALDMVEIAGRKGMVHLYVEHPVSEAEVIDFLPSCFKDNPTSDEHVDDDEESPEPVVNQTGDHEVSGKFELCFRYLIKIPPRHWSKSRFTPEAKSDMLLNNMSEAFNSVIVEARHKPIITMCDDIRVYLMERWSSNRLKVLAWEGTVLPKIKKKLEMESANTKYWLTRVSARLCFEVRHISSVGDRFTVDLNSKDYACRKWMLTGIPCVHAITCMKNVNLNPEDFIPDYYKKDHYAAVYAPIIYPVLGQNQWSKTPYTDVEAPKVKKMPGTMNLEPHLYIFILVVPI